MWKQEEAENRRVRDFVVECLAVQLDERLVDFDVIATSVHTKQTPWRLVYTMSSEVHRESGMKVVSDKKGGNSAETLAQTMNFRENADFAPHRIDLAK